MAMVATVGILVAVIGLVRALLALLHHEAFYWVRVRANIPTWFNPWQSIALNSLILAVAIYVLLLAVRNWRK
jgi:hypothetical protein